MANPIRGEVAVTIGDREFILCFSADAACQLEARLDQDPTEIAKRVFFDASIRFRRSLLWAALLHHQRKDGRPEFDEVAAGELLLEPGSEVLPAKLAQCWGVCWPIPVKEIMEAAEAAEPDPPKPSRKAGTGKRSSASTPASLALADRPTSGRSPRASSRKRSTARSAG